MQTGKSQAKNIWIIPETRFTEFPELSIDRRAAISWSAVKTDDRLFFLSIIGKMVVCMSEFLLFPLFFFYD